MQMYVCGQHFHFFHSLEVGDIFQIMEYVQSTLFLCLFHAGQTVSHQVQMVVGHIAFSCIGLLYHLLYLLGVKLTESVTRGTSSRMYTELSTVQIGRDLLIYTRTSIYYFVRSTEYSALRYAGCRFPIPNTYFSRHRVLHTLRSTQLYINYVLYYYQYIKIL